jgi:hypothetical protein
MPSQSVLPEEQQLVWHHTPIPALAPEVNLGTPTAIAAGSRTFDVLEPQVVKVELVRLVGLERPLWSFGHAQVAKSGVFQPNTQPFRGHLDHSVVRNFRSVGHLLDRQGEREGNG